MLQIFRHVAFRSYFSERKCKVDFLGILKFLYIVQITMFLHFISSLLKMKHPTVTVYETLVAGVRRRRKLLGRVRITSV